MKHQNFAERFKSARIMSGYSLQDLEDKLNKKVSRQALHKYEKGLVMPDSEMLALLCNALNVRPDYFLQTQSVVLENIEFRKLKKLPAKDQYKIVEKTRDSLARYLELEEILGVETVFENQLKDYVVNSAEDVEAAAIHLREKWGLGRDPIYNVLSLLEDKGIKIIEIEDNSDFSGLQTMVGKVPVIVVNRNADISLDRLRFTAMHELGHLLLENINELPENVKEKYCHRFAAAMLLHKESVKEEIGEHRTKVIINELGMLKMQYGISIQAIAYRLNDLGIIKDNYLKQFMFFMSQYGYRRQEPEKYNFKGEEKSYKFDQLLFRALAEELISISKAASLKNQKLAEFRSEYTLA